MKLKYIGLALLTIKVGGAFSLTTQISQAFNSSLNVLKTCNINLPNTNISLKTIAKSDAKVDVPFSVNCNFPNSVQFSIVSEYYDQNNGFYLQQQDNENKIYRMYLHLTLNSKLPITDKPLNVEQGAVNIINVSVDGKSLNTVPPGNYNGTYTLTISY